MIQATNNVISEVKNADEIKPHPCDSCVQDQTSIGLKHQHVWMSFEEMKRTWNLGLDDDSGGREDGTYSWCSRFTSVTII